MTIHSIPLNPVPLGKPGTKSEEGENTRLSKRAPFALHLEYSAKGGPKSGKVANKPGRLEDKPSNEDAMLYGSPAVQENAPPVEVAPSQTEQNDSMRQPAVDPARFTELIKELVGVLEGFEMLNNAQSTLDFADQLQTILMEEAQAGGNAAEAASRVMARMPIPLAPDAEGVTQARVKNFLDGYLSPLENANGPTPEASFIPQSPGILFVEELPAADQSTEDGLGESLGQSDGPAKSETPAQNERLGQGGAFAVDAPEEPTRQVAVASANEEPAAKKESQDSSEPSLKAAFARQLTPQPPVAERLQSGEVSVSSVFEQIVDGLSAATKDGAKEFTLQLKPEFLGAMTIKLVLGEEGLTAKIRTSEGAVRDLITSQISQLEQSLKDKGINVVEMDVTSQANISQFDPHSKGGSQAWTQENQKRFSLVSISGGMTTSVTDAYPETGVSAEGSSVEFTA